MFIEWKEKNYISFLALKQKYEVRNGRAKISLKCRIFTGRRMILILILIFLNVSQNISKYQKPLFSFFTFVFVLVYILLLTRDYVIDFSGYRITLCAKVVFSLYICYLI